MKVLVADRLSEGSLDEMRTLGVSVIYRPELGPAELSAALADINVLVVRGTEVNSDAIQAGKALNLIIRAGAGIRRIDVKAASRRGILCRQLSRKKRLGRRRADLHFDRLP